jgi:hypothetical protein
MTATGPVEGCNPGGDRGEDTAALRKVVAVR